MARVLHPRCSVCGRFHEHMAPCPPAVLRGIDAADSAAWEAELDPTRRAISDSHRNYSDRLSEGFRIMGDDMPF